MASPSGVPVPTQPIEDANGYVTEAWRQFFVTLWTRTGGASGGGLVGNITAASTATGLGNFRTDALAAAGGVPLHGLYWNGSVLQVRRV